MDGPRALRATLTNTAIEAMQPGDELKDERVPGLSVRARAGGKSFVLYYRNRVTRQPRRPTIGRYGVLSIAQARDIARAMLAEVAAGKDPVAERKAVREEPTLDELWLRCRADHYVSTTAWGKEAARLYRSGVQPRLGGRRVRSLAYADVQGVHAALKASPTTANRTLSILSKTMDLAERWGYRDTGSNPCRHVERYPEASRRRYASHGEIAAIGPILERHATDKRNLAGVAFLYLLMFSGARPSEIGNATPAMVERVEREGVVYGVLRLEHGKTGRRDVFLPPQAMAVLERLPAKRARLADRRTVPHKLWKKVRDEAGCPDLWPRDWRRTFGTLALSGGMPIGIVGELLGHADPKTTKIYAKLLEDGAHDAAAGVAAQMERLLGGMK